MPEKNKNFISKANGMYKRNYSFRKQEILEIRKLYRNYDEWYRNRNKWLLAKLCQKQVFLIEDVISEYGSGQEVIGLCSVLRPRQHSIGYMGDGFYRSKDPTNSIKVLKEMLQRKTTQKT